MSKTKRKNMVKRQKEKKRQTPINTKKAINKKALIITSVSVILVIFTVLAAVLIYNSLNKKTEYQAADFTVLDKHGKEVKLSDFQGKPVVLNFWATWCGYCTQEMPAFEQMYKKYDGKVEFLMVNLTSSSDETLAKAEQFIRDSGYTFPAYYDNAVAGGSVSDSYNTNQIPLTYFFDENGNTIRKHLGAITVEELEKQIKYLIED